MAEQDYQQYVDRITEQARDYEPLTTVPEGANVDPAPALGDVSPEFNTAVDDVDLSGMPAVRDMKKMLPAARMRVQKQLVKLKELESKLPDSFKNGDPTDEVSEEDFEIVCEMMEAAQDFLLGQAEDREAMEQWLINSEEPEKALFAAMGKVASRLGN